MRFLLTVFYLLLFVLSGWAQNTNRPNFIILIADDISQEDIACYGHPVLQTPNIDELAKNGIRFDNAILTASSCSPSRTSIITGRYPHNTGACELHSPIPEGQLVFPQLLKNNGYYTAQAGKWHFGDQPVKPSGVALSAFDRTGGSAKDGGGQSGAEKWVEYLQQRPMDKPFFMWFAAHDAHRVWDDEIFTKRYEKQDVIVPPYMVDDRQTREDLVCYYNEVTRFDYFIGQVVEELKKQNILDNTFILVMADNGRPFPRDKTRFYDSGIKTPFVVHFPDGIENKGAYSESLLSVIDIAPTILELAGCEIEPVFQGMSFTSLLNNPEKDLHQYVFAEHNWHDYKAYGRMVRTKEFLYIENGLPNQNMAGPKDALDGGAGQALKAGFEKGTLNELQGRVYQNIQPETELYQLSSDSLQTQNISGYNNYRKIEKQLKKALHKWQKKTHDSKPDNLTEDWYSRVDGTPTDAKGSRGEMPGEANNAKAIRK
ncbi:MAG: sulfatase [Bacteroidales bacterium]|nr:sulfatase [Bacteroidales bacterium]